MGSGQTKKACDPQFSSDAVEVAPVLSTPLLIQSVKFILPPVVMTTSQISKPITMKIENSKIVQRQSVTGSSQRSSSKSKGKSPAKLRGPPQQKDSTLPVISEPSSSNDFKILRMQRPVRLRLKEKKQEEPQTMLMMLQKKNKKQQQKDIPHGNWNDKTEVFVLSKRKDIKREYKETQQHVDAAIRKLMLLNILPNPTSNLQIIQKRGSGVKKQVDSNIRVNYSAMLIKDSEEEEDGIQSIISAQDARSEMKHISEETHEKKEEVMKQKYQNYNSLNLEKSSTKVFLRKSMLDIHQQRMIEFLQDDIEQNEDKTTQSTKTSQIENFNLLGEESLKRSQKASPLKKIITPQIVVAPKNAYWLPKIAVKSQKVEETVAQEIQVNQSSHKLNLPLHDSGTVVKLNLLRGKYLSNKNYF